MSALFPCALLSWSTRASYDHKRDFIFIQFEYYRQDLIRGNIFQMP
jgi:hypothetical protein